MSSECFIHVDIDAFYASVEQLDNPEYRGKPVIVGSLPTDRRGVVSTCSYEARAFGVHSAMPIITAYRLCPQGIFVRGRMKRYQEKSLEVMSVFADFSPDIHQISIDEAFIDITGTERLFGSPEEVAQKLKAEVHNRTGLTVSVGVAPTKYIAKISSDFKKPNGLYIVKDGDEEKFMLNLPLKKVWGIGNKTLTRINAAGFFTCADLHKASLSLLKSLFGNATGIFLYDAVRGRITETFSQNPKSRSISSEKTFSFDLNDIYTIESSLMELSWDIMFRLFTEGVTSKTVHLKIRYEDFTTVSIQETAQRAISSADDLFTRIKKLFHKKYENGRGIRLLGIAAQNIEDGTGEKQQELFDFGDKKKIAIEKAVIELQKKNPKLHIGKARLLKNLSILFFVFSFFLPQKLYTEETESINYSKPFENALSVGEAPVAIFNISPNSPEVEFYAEGTWEARLSSGFDIDSEEGNGIAFSFNPPIFSQKTDLIVWFLLQDTWYFEANIADDFAKTTVAAGYIGDSVVKNVRIGNRYINFPKDYGITDANRGVGSGSTQAPGIMAEFADDDWKIDTILRYDMTESLEKTWVGKNESNETIYSLNEWEKGARFNLPEGLIDNIDSIYVETNDNSITSFSDKEGTKYKKLTNSEYLLIPIKNMIVFNKPTEGSILVSFTIPKPNFGSFSPKLDFLGDIQECFGDDIDLVNFAIGNSSNDFYTEINGKDALYLQKEKFFSPFIDASLYAISSFSKVNMVQIISESTRLANKDYRVVILDDKKLELPGFITDDYIEQKDTYIQVYNNTMARKEFPFADTHPLVYLSPKSNDNLTQANTDIVLSIQSYTSSSVLDIGTDAIPGSIIVYRNGIKESLFRYDNKTGLVNLTSPQSDFDTIRITWQQNNENTSTGIITAAIGFEKTMSPYFNMNLSSSLLWPILEKNSFTDTSLNAKASVNLAYDIMYEKNDLKIDNTVLTSFEKPDITDAYRIDGMNSSIVEERYLTRSAGIKLPDNFVPYLNKRPDAINQIEQLDLQLKGSTKTETIRNKTEGVYIVKTDWNIEKESGWIAQSIDLNENATSLASAESFSLWIQQANLPPTYSIYLQLGVSNDEESIFESKNEIPTWEITEKTSLTSDVLEPFDTNTNDWQKITVKLQDEDRAKLSNEQNARIIIKCIGSVIDTETLYVGPFYINSTSFSLEGEGLHGEEVSLYESKQVQTEEMFRFNRSIDPATQYFSWDGSKSSKMIATKHLDPMPLSSYETLSFFAYIPTLVGSNNSITVSLQRDSDFGLKTALQMTLKDGALILLKDAWHQLKVNLATEELYIDNTKISTNEYTIHHLDTSFAPTMLSLDFTGTGSLYITELHLQDSMWEFSAENNFKLAWKKDSVIIGTDKFPIIANPKIQSEIVAGIAVPLEGNTTDAKLALNTDMLAGVDILGVSAEGSVIFSSSNIQNSLLQIDPAFAVESASHSLSTKPIFKAFEVLQLKEEYRFLTQSKAAKKIENFILDFSPIGFNFSLDFLTEAEQEQEKYQQDVNITNNILFGGEKFSYTIKTYLFANQIGQKKDERKQNYFNSWVNISTLQFSCGNNDAEKRDIGFSVEQVFDIKKIDFRPSIVLEGKNTYTASSIIENSSSDIFTIAFPFSIKDHDFNASLAKKSFIDSEVTQNGNYVQDAQYYIETFKERSWAYTSIPFYDFYDPSLIAKMQNSIKSTSTLGYTSEFKLNWQRKYFSNPFDLVIPTSIDFTFSRDIRASTIDTTDILQFSTQLQYLSINNFGRFGSKKLFNWYEQDEFIQSLKISYQTDKIDSSSWTLRFAGYNQLSIYFDNTNILRTLLESQFTTNKDWNINFTAKWERPGKESIVADGLQYLFPNLEESFSGINRSNSMYFKIKQDDKNEEEVKKISHSYGITHEVDIRITDFAEIGFETELELSITDRDFNVLNTISLVGRLKF